MLWIEHTETLKSKLYIIFYSQTAQSNWKQKDTFDSSVIKVIQFTENQISAHEIFCTKNFKHSLHLKKKKTLPR